MFSTREVEKQYQQKQKKLCKNSSIDWPGVRGGGERKFSMVKYCLIIPKKHQIFTDFPENLSSLSFCKYYRG